MSLPVQLKPYKRFLVQANRIQKVNPLVSYYCRLHALTKVLEIPKAEREKSVNIFLGEMMDRLEESQKTMQIDRENDGLLVKGFADQVFGVADDTDREGNASMETSHAFMTALCVFEAMESFPDLYETSEVQHKIKYSRWKAVEISKAIKEGRVPVPGGAEEKVEDKDVDEDSNIADSPVEEQWKPKVEPVLSEKVLHNAPEEVKSSRKSKRKKQSVKELQQLNRAEELTRQALSAIRFSDSSLGITKLKEALLTLEQLQ